MARKKKGMFEKIEAEVFNEAEHYVEEKVKKRALRLAEFSILVILAFIMFTMGLATYLAHVFTSLSNGLNYLIVGIILVLLSLLFN